MHAGSWCTFCSSELPSFDCIVSYLVTPTLSSPYRPHYIRFPHHFLDLPIINSPSQHTLVPTISLISFHYNFFLPLHTGTFLPASLIVLPLLTHPFHFLNPKIFTTLTTFASSSSPRAGSGAPSLARPWTTLALGSSLPWVKVPRLWATSSLTCLAAHRVGWW